MSRENKDTGAGNNGMRTLCALPDAKGRQRLKAAGALAAVSALSSLMPMLGLYVILSAVLAEPRDIEKAWNGALFALAGIFLQIVFHYASTRLSHMTAFQTMHSVRSALLEKLARVPLGYLSENSAGSIKSRIFDDVEKLEVFYGHIYPEIIGNLLVPLAMIVMVFVMDWRVGIAMLLPIAIYVMCFGSMGRLAMKNYPLMEAATQKLNGSLIEYVHGMKEIRLFAAQGSIGRRFENAAGEYHAFMKGWFGACRHAMTVNAIAMSSGVVFVFPVAGWLFVTGRIDSAAFLFYLFASMCYAMPLTRIASYGDEMNMCIQVAVRLDGMRSRSELRTEPGYAEPSSWDVEFDNVCFGYGDAEFMNGLSFVAPAGKVTALVGPSGGGKSTIAKLIARFWDVREGSIRIGGTDIRTMTQEQLASKLAFVTQSSMVFEQSVAENIRLGNPEATMDEVVECAKAARCHDFITALPQGYDTVLGKDVAISGGERQRIAIARALLKNAPILVLDEATAYCDPDNEDELQKALSALVQGKTVIVIAHRLSSVVDADVINVVAGGSIVASGTHSELLAGCGMYGNMWKAWERSEHWLAGESA